MTLTYADLKAMGASRQPVPDDSELPHIGGVTPDEQRLIDQRDE